MISIRRKTENHIITTDIRTWKKKESEPLTEELKEIAEATYIHTSNKEADSIYNKMIDNMVKQQTIKMSDESGEETDINVDMKNYIVKYEDLNDEDIEANFIGYLVFEDTEMHSYRDMFYHSIIESSIENFGKKDIIKNCIFPFYDYMDFEKCSIKLEDEEDTYKIRIKEDDYSVKFTINKESMLLTSLVYSNSYEKYKYKFSYDNEEIIFPEMYLDLDQDYVCEGDENYKYYYIYTEDRDSDLDNIEFYIPENFELVSDYSYKKQYELEDESKDSFIICNISTMKTKSIDKCINFIAKKYKVSKNDIYDVEINDLNWKIITYEGTNGLEGLGVFEYKDSFYMCSYSMEEGMEEYDCFEDIIKSIKPKANKTFSNTYNSELECFNKRLMYGVDVKSCIEKVIRINKEQNDYLIYVEIKCKDMDELEICKESEISEEILSEEFRRKKFKCANIDYDDITGDIIKIYFEEVE